MKRARRHKYLIDGKLQLRLTAVALAYVAFYIVMMIAAIFVPLIFELRAADPNSHQAYLLAKNFIYLHGHIWPIVLLVMAIVCLHSLWFTHKVAGPLYRFRQIFLAIADGKVPGQQRLRKRDYLQPEMKLINKMLWGLREKEANLRDTQKAIANSIAGIAQRNRALSDKELALLVENLEIQGKRLAENVLPIDSES